MAEQKKTGFAHRLYTGELSYDFVGRRRLWYTISAVLIGISLLALAFFRLNLGIEFRGGAEFRSPAAVSAQTVPQVRDAVKNLGLPDMDGVSVTTGNDDVRVQTRSLNVDEVAKIRAAMAKVTGTAADKVDYSLIGASWGKEITQQGVVALVVFLILVMGLIWAYFRESKMSLAAIVALVHDLIITIGLYALARFTVTPATLIGVLTILGYSLYDTVVVFDKVRENTRGLEKTRHTYSHQANKALNQVLVRSLNTTVIGVLPVAALLLAGIFVLGTGPLKDLGLALFIGMIAGAYSSVFIATPLLAQMKESEPGMREHRAQLARVDARAESRRAARRPAAVVAPAGVATEPDGPAETLAPVTRPARPAGGATAVARPRTVAGDATSTTRQQTRHQTRAARKKS